MPLLSPPNAASVDGFASPPSDSDVLEEWAQRSDPTQLLTGIVELERRNIRIVKEKISDDLYAVEIPLIGPAQLHKVQYKCTVSYTRVLAIGFPFVYTLVCDESAFDTLIVNRDHFHSVDDKSASATKLLISRESLEARAKRRQQKKAILETKVAELKRLQDEIVDLRQTSDDRLFMGFELVVHEVSENRVHKSGFDWNKLRKTGLKLADNDTDGFLKVLTDEPVVRAFVEPKSSSLDALGVSLVVKEGRRHEFQLDCHATNFENRRIRLETNFKISQFAGVKFSPGAKCGDVTTIIDQDAAYAVVADSVLRIGENGKMEQVGLVFVVKPSFAKP
jgi:hypothetical protein